MTHAVLFPHDCDKVAFDCLSEEHVVNAIKIQFVTQEQNVDTLIRDTLGSNNIIGRFHIIWQWLAVLNKIHNGYKLDERSFPTRDEFNRKKELYMDQINKIISNANKVTSEETIEFEQSL